MEYKIKPGLLWINPSLFLILSILTLYMYVDGYGMHMLIYSLVLIWATISESREFKKHRNDIIIVSDAGIYISLLDEERIFKWENIKFVDFARDCTKGVCVRIVLYKKEIFDIDFGRSAYWVVNFYRFKKKICLFSGRKDIIRIKSKMWYFVIVFT